MKQTGHRAPMDYIYRMAAKQSAGILLYRIKNSLLQVFIVHPGGPFWKNKDQGAWSIPKGEFDQHEDPLSCAIREFEEETGTRVSGKFIELNQVKLKSGKSIHSWALQGDIDPATLISNRIEIEWPPRSGEKISVPEVDKGQWCTLDEAAVKLNPAQVPLLQDLKQKLNK